MKDSQLNKSGNMEFHSNENYIVISLSSNLFSLDAIQSVSSFMLDKAHIVIDGDPKKIIIVELKPKEKNKDLEEIGREFNNKLIIYVANKIQEKRNKELKENIMQPDLVTSQDIQETGFSDEGFSKIEENLKELEQSSLDDPLGISKPWGETGTKAKSGQKNQETTSSDDLITIDQIKSK